MDRRTLMFAGGTVTRTAYRHALRAQAFPSRPITLYCAFPAGGPTDQVMRAFAEVRIAQLEANRSSSRTSPGPAARSRHSH